MPAWFPILLVAHIVLAVSLILPSILLPFALRTRRAAADDKTWLERAKRQRYVSYLMAGLVGTIGFLMSSKPVLW